MNLSSVGSWKQASTSSDSDDGLPKNNLLRQESFFATCEVDELISGMKEMTVPKDVPPPLPPRRVVNYDVPSPIPARKYIETFVQDEDALKKYVELLRTATRKTMRKVIPELSLNGRNVLHYIALEPDFSKYESVVAKRRSHKDFHQLVLEQSTEDFLCPLHVICQKVNVQMLTCLLASQNERMIESLRSSGAFTDGHKRTLLHCFGDGLIAGYKAAQESVLQEKSVPETASQSGLVDKRIVALRKSNEAFKIRSVEMLHLLEKLYGSKVPGELLDKVDCEEDTLMSLAKRACREDIVQIICDIKIRSLKAQ